MRPRTPSFLWIPFVFSVGGISWALLAVSLAIIAAVIVGPVLEEVRVVEKQRNEIRASVALLDQKIALHKQFLDVATRDPLVMQRLASRQFHLERKDQEVLPLEGTGLGMDRSIAGLIAESIKPVEVEAVGVRPWFFEPVLNKATRMTLLMAACAGLGLSFVLSVRYTPA